MVGLKVDMGGCSFEAASVVPLWRTAKWYRAHLFMYERVEIGAALIGLFWRETWQECHLSNYTPIKSPSNIRLHKCPALTHPGLFDYSTLALGGRVRKFGLALGSQGYGAP